MFFSPPSNREFLITLFTIKRLRRVTICTICIIKRPSVAPFFTFCKLQDATRFRERLLGKKNIFLCLLLRDDLV